MRKNSGFALSVGPKTALKIKVHYFQKKISSILSLQMSQEGSGYLQKFERRVSLVLDRVVMLDNSELSANGLTIKDRGWVSINKDSWLLQVIEADRSRGYSLKYVLSTFLQFFFKMHVVICIYVFLMTFRLHMTKISSIKLKKKFSAHGRYFSNLGVPPWQFFLD